MSQVSEEGHAERTHERKCSNCGTNHKPRQCPAYRDACNACGAIGHWEKCCRKKRLQSKQTHKPSDSGTRRRSNSSQWYKHGKHTQENRIGWDKKDVHSLENSEDHDRNLTKLMGRAQEEWLLFNYAKCIIKQRSIILSCFGNTYSDNGFTHDDDKVRDNQNMPTPGNREDQHRIIGMMIYHSQCIQHFAEKAYTLLGLLKKDVPWMWDVDHQKTFDELKYAVSTSACLQYYAPTAPVQLDVDASMKLFGISLVQKGIHVAFGSKTLAECQSRYSNIEREMLAMVYGIQRYHTYLYGRPVKVIADHKHS